jgi:hypothetical protein
MTGSYTRRGFLGLSAAAVTAAWQPAPVGAPLRSSRRRLLRPRLEQSARLHL